MRICMYASLSLGEISASRALVLLRRAFVIKILIVFSIVFSSLSHASVTHGERIYQGWKSTYNRSPAKFNCPAYCPLVASYSNLYGVPQNLIIAIIQNESAFNPNAVSPKGAKGLMQLMDINSRAANINPFDPEQNIRTGTKLFARLLKQYDNVELALAAYNAGEGNVAKYGGIPPFPETKVYIQRVMSHYQSSLKR